jgi:hypothetical protein
MHASAEQGCCPACTALQAPSQQQLLLLLLMPHQHLLYHPHLCSRLFRWLLLL